MLRWLAVPALLAPLLGSAAAEPFRIALVENSRSAEGQHAEQGFRLGLDYATKGALAVGGRAIELAVLDDGGDPKQAARLLAEAFRRKDAGLAVNTDPSAEFDVLSVAADFRRILLVARNSNTGASAGPSRVVFRTAPTEDQLALACVLALGAPELNLMAVAANTDVGQTAVAALKGALEQVPRGAFYAGSIFVRADPADVGAAVSSVFDDFHYLHGAKTLLTLWSGPHPPIPAIAAENPGRLGIRLALCGDMDPNARSAEPLPPLEGVTSYFYTLPRNRVNDWLNKISQERNHEQPDDAVASGMTAAIAVVEALSAAPSTETDALISSLEGLSFETPKGRMTFRAEDHQALQVMYYFRIESPSTLPELAHKIDASEMPLSIRRSP